MTKSRWLVLGLSAGLLWLLLAIHGLAAGSRMNVVPRSGSAPLNVKVLFDIEGPFVGEACVEIYDTPARIEPRNVLSEFCTQAVVTSGVEYQAEIDLTDGPPGQWQFHGVLWRSTEQSTYVREDLNTIVVSVGR